MGTLRYYTDPTTGRDIELSDHEGYVEIELVEPYIVDDHGSYCLSTTIDGRHWTSTWSRHRPASTGSCRAACECGWRGPATSFTPDDLGEPTEATHDRVMEAWSDHADAIIGVDQVRLAARAERDAADRLAHAVAAARADGRSWEEIARSIGVSRQAAWQRFH